MEAIKINWTSFYIYDKYQDKSLVKNGNYKMEAIKINLTSFYTKCLCEKYDKDNKTWQLIWSDLTSSILKYLMEQTSQLYYLFKKNEES